MLLMPSPRIRWPNTDFVLSLSDGTPGTNVSFSSRRVSGLGLMDVEDLLVKGYRCKRHLEGGVTSQATSNAQCPDDDREYHDSR